MSHINTGQQVKIKGDHLCCKV